MISGSRKALSLVGLGLVVGFIAFEMFHSLAPPRHADHDHAMASLDAGGFLRVESLSGKHRNFVGRPGRVLVLHFLDPRDPDPSHPAGAARFAARLAGDPDVEMVFVVRAESAGGLETWARTIGVNPQALYLDEEGRTSTLLGVKRWPETLIYDPEGLLVHQAMGAANWADPGLQAQIERAKAGVEEIH
jgi:hypothetical protein